MIASAGTNKPPHLPSSCSCKARSGMNFFSPSFVTAGYVSASSILGASQTELEVKLNLSSFHIVNFLNAAVSYVLPKQLSGVLLLL